MRSACKLGLVCRQTDSCTETTFELQITSPDMTMFDLSVMTFEEVHSSGMVVTYGLSRCVVVVPVVV